MALPIFPDIPSMAWNNKKIQRWNTVIKKAGSRKRKTMTTWAYPEWELKMAFACLDQSAIEKVAGFLGLVKGQLSPFLWKDMEDYKQEKVRIGQGNGSSKGFQLLRNYGGYYVEPVRDVVAGTLVVYVNDVPTLVTLKEDGWIEISTVPPVGAVITASFEYYWRVAFADDELDWDLFWYGFYKLNTFSVVTVA